MAEVEVVNSSAVDAITTDLESQRFRVGVSRGFWRLVESTHPVYIFAVSGPGASADDIVEYAFRFELSGYPATAPWVQLWDLTTKQQLPAKQQPSRNELLRQSFKPWGNHGGSVYRPWDRYAGAHNGWNSKYPDLAWNPRRDLSFVLNDLHQILNSPGC